MGVAMDYRDGQPVLLGDRVDLGSGMTGTVVAVIDRGEFSSRYPADEWGYLSVGALIESPTGGVMHCIDALHDFELLERK